MLMKFSDIPDQSMVTVKNRQWLHEEHEFKCTVVDGERYFMKQSSTWQNMYRCSTMESVFNIVIVVPPVKKETS
jgi:hypothetical protein